MKITKSLLITALLLSAFFAQGAIKANSTSQVTISGHFSCKKAPSEVSLMVWDDIAFEERKTFLPHRTITAKVINGNFRIQIDSIGKFAYLSFGWQFYRGLLIEYLSLCTTAPGDNIHISIDDNKSFVFAERSCPLDDNGDSILFGAQSLKFSGKGAARYECKYQLDKKARELQFAWDHETVQKSYPDLEELKSSEIKGDLTMFRNSQRKANKLIAKELKILAGYQNRIDAPFYDVIKADLLSSAMIIPLNPLPDALYSIGSEMKAHPDKAALAKIKEELKNSVLMSDQIGRLMPVGRLAHSAFYSQYLLKKIASEAYFYDWTIDVNTVTKGIYKRIMNIQQPLLRERLLLTYFYKYGSKLNSIFRDSIEREAYAQGTSKEYKSLILNLIASHKTGNGVTDFSLPNDKDELVSLHDFKGKVVLVDFWYVGCAGCTQYYQECLKKTEERFKENKEVVFITLCMDKKREKLLEGINSGLYTSPDVINLYCKALGINDPVFRQFNVITVPHPLLIDRKGNIFSDSDKELRSDGVEGLTSMINKALASK